MSTNTDAFENHIKSLSPEILLKIFLNLESHQTTIIRSVCKEFLEIIDNNKSLWRILDWIQQGEDSSIPAPEMFDQKSASTLKEVSIFQAEGVTEDRLLEILRRSRDTLTDLSLKIQSFKETFSVNLMELASSSPGMNSLVLWPCDEYCLPQVPKTRLTRGLARSCSRFSPETDRSSNLRILWWWYSVKDWDRKGLELSSLVSFADSSRCNALRLPSFISNFSESIIHLAISPASAETAQAVSCPSLQILEGRFASRFPSWLDAPNLQIIIAGDVREAFIQDLPVSIQELWLLDADDPSMPVDFWDSLPLVCPELKVMKVGRAFFENDSTKETFLVALRWRQDRVKEGAEIKGMKMVSLEKLIIPTELFKPVEIHDLEEIAGEVVDINDYPDFIELEY